MKTYTKPSVNVIELAIEENIAAIVPKTVYKTKKSKGKVTIGFDSLDEGFDPGSIPTTGFNS